MKYSEKWCLQIVVLPDCRGPVTTNTLKCGNKRSNSFCISLYIIILIQCLTDLKFSFKSVRQRYIFFVIMQNNKIVSTNFFAFLQLISIFVKKSNEK